MNFSDYETKIPYGPSYMTFQAPHVSPKDLKGLLRNTQLLYEWELDREVRESSWQSQRAEHRQDQRRLDALFKKDVLEELGLLDHPKADLLWLLAGDRLNRYSDECHDPDKADMYTEVYELADLLRD